MKHNHKYTKEKLTESVSENITIAGVLRTLGIPLSGGMHAYISVRIAEYGIDTSHFLGSRANRGKDHKGGPDKLTAAQVLVYDRRNGYRERTDKLHRALLEIGRKHICALCESPPLWQGKKLVLPIDHRDGDFLNNAPDNLRFLCPNCHSQTENFNRPKDKQ